MPGIFIHILDGKEYCGLSTTGKETIQNINHHKSNQMFYRIGAIFIPVSFIIITIYYEISKSFINKKNSKSVFNFCSFSYIIEQDVCFLTLCDRNFNKKLAYSFLEDLSQEFYNQYGHKINTANRPYSFIEFGK